MRTGGAYVSEVQRARMLNAVVALVAEVGYAQMSVERVVRKAGVSRRTFCECFEDLEECFLAAFDETVERIAAAIGAAYERELSWPEQVRGAIFALLELLEREPATSRLVFVETLAGGPRVLAHRAGTIERLKRLFGEGGERACEIKTIDGVEVSEQSPLSEPSPLESELSPLTAEGMVNAVLGILHTRIVGQGTPALIELVNPLTAMITLPYIGGADAARELHRPVPQRGRSSAAAAAMNGGGPPPPAGAYETAGELGRPSEPARSSLEGLKMRFTYRTLCVLAAIAEQGEQGHNPSNREIADAAGISDQGQISRLLRRLERLGLVENLGRGHTQGEPNAWRLTAKGAEVQRAVGVPND